MNMRILLMLLLLGFTHPVIAGEKTVKPLWEIGLAGAVISTPHYVGSDQRYTLPLAVPYLIYRGEFLRADRDGVRGRLLETNGLSLDLDFSFGLPVKNNNNARQGMPALHLTGQVGPQLNWVITDRDEDKLSLHLPYRIAVDTSQTFLGWVTEPALRYERYDILPELEKVMLRLEGGLLYASQRFNRNYYGVDPIYATATRPAYVAKKGLHSYYLDTILRYKYDEDLSIGVVVRMRTLAPGVNADSPLVRKNFYLSTGIGFAWSFWSSQEKVMR